eukprot:tig00000821_g4514.t1
MPPKRAAPARRAATRSAPAPPAPAAPAVVAKSETPSIGGLSLGDLGFEFSLQYKQPVEKGNKASYGVTARKVFPISGAANLEAKVSYDLTDFKMDGTPILDLKLGLKL